jgi:hypothetical protein
MTEVSDTLKEWIAAGEPFLLIATGALVAACFVLFNAVRVFLYIPQIATCWSDRHGCRTINLYTWCSWLVANASTGLYMWMFQSDLLGLCLNLGNALMCAVTVAITLFKRRQRSFGPSVPG